MMTASDRNAIELEASSGKGGLRDLLGCACKYCKDVTIPLVTIVFIFSEHPYKVCNFW